MKVLYVITKSEMGGAQIHIAGLMRRHNEKGDTVAVLAHPGGFLEDFCREQNVDFFSNTSYQNTFNIFTLVNALTRTIRIIKDFKPDVVACHSGIAGVMGRLGAFLSRIPVVYTVHSYAFMPGHPYVRRIFAYIGEYFLSFISTETISVSQYGKQIAEKYGLYRAREIQVIYNGVPCESLEGTPVGINTRERHIVFVGRLARPKTPGIIIRALSQISSNVRIPVIFHIVGDGPERESLESLVKDLRLSQYVIFHGSCIQSEVRSLLEHADVFVLPSDWEGLPISILEAMSYGVPVVASDVGGVRELITSETGILMNKNAQPADWAHQIITILTDIERSKHLGIKAKKRICERFSFEETFRKTVEIYQKVIDKRS